MTCKWDQIDDMQMASKNADALLFRTSMGFFRGTTRYHVNLRFAFCNGDYPLEMEQCLHLTITLYI